MVIGLNHVCMADEPFLLDTNIKTDGCRELIIQSENAIEIVKVANQPHTIRRIGTKKVRLFKVIFKEELQVICVPNKGRVFSSTG